jgi:hypothetical protein
MPDSGTCGLCHKEANLRQSHIVPSFFGVLLKETSATGFARGPVSPNLRVQDLRKEALLCDSCEGRFAVWEKAYKEKALHIVQNDEFRQLEYGTWLLPFLVSLSWRVLVTRRDELAVDHPQFSALVDRTLENWRLFLLGNRKQPHSEHHLFIFAGMPQGIPDSLHEKFLHYAYRSVDATVALSSRALGIYTKPLRSLVFSPIMPASPSGWVNTRVHAGQGKLVSPQKIAMAGFLDFLNSRVEEVFSEPLSETQMGKIRESMMRDPIGHYLRSLTRSIRLVKNSSLVGRNRDIACTIFRKSVGSDHSLGRSKQ